MAAAFWLFAPNNALACSGASCEGLDPVTSGCEASTTWNDSIQFYSCRGDVLCERDKTRPYAGTVVFSYSATCDATWAYLYPGVPWDARGLDSISISGKGGMHEVTGTINETSSGELTSVMVAGWGARVWVSYQYATIDPVTGYVNFYNESGRFLPPKQTLLVKPKFHVVGLTYSPPGKQSIVSYGGTSSAGSEVSTSSSFKLDYSVTAKAFGSGLSGGLSINSSTSNSVQVARTSTLSFDTKSFSDPIDRKNDLFWVWVNPQVDITVTPGLSPLEWMLRTDSSGFTHVLPLSVENAIDPATIPAGYKSYFTKLTREDYDEILKLHPYVDVATRTVRTTIPVATSPRYEATPYSLPLDGRIGVSLKTVDSKSVKRTDSYQQSIDVGIDSGVDLFKVLTLKTSSKFTWTYGTSRNSTWNTSQSAEVSLKTSSTTFAGVYDVYFDRLFGTFLLVDAPVTPIRATGIVHDASGHPVMDERVTMTLSDGSQRITYTDGDGRYRFHNLPDTTATIEARGKHRTGRMETARPLTIDF